MALVTRYFSTTSAGSRDGTTWADRARLFNSNVAVNSATWSGPFTPGETVTQTGTGATAVVELAGGSGAVLSLSSVAGTPNSSGVWTGGTSGATVTPTATPSADNWSMVIRNFDFSGSDSLECRIGPGTYTCGQSLTNGLLLNVPSTINPLFLIGCDNSGNRLNIPDKNWRSSQPGFSTATLPEITTTSNIATIGVDGRFSAMLLHFTASGRTGGGVLQFSSSTGFVLLWCVVTNATSNASASAVSSSESNFLNCVFRCTGSEYSRVAHMVNSGGIALNCRFEGNPAATSGGRHGIENNAGRMIASLYQCTIVRNPGTGINLAVAHINSGLGHYRNCIVANNGVDGISGSTITSLNTSFGVRYIENTIITGNGGWAVNQQTHWQWHSYVNCRMRDNASGKLSLGLGNHVEIDADDSAGTDADEFVDSANGDYRIKKTSTLWGKNLGAGDEPGGGGVPLIGTGGLVY